MPSTLKATHIRDAEDTPFADKCSKKRAWYEDEEDEADRCPTCVECGTKCTSCRAKRQRTMKDCYVPDTTLKPMAEYQRSEVYKKDGDVVLIVEDFLMRVHQAKLTRYRGLFQDVFALPQPPSAEKIDGVPFCHVPGVTHQDMVYVVKFIYDEVKPWWYVSNEHSAGIMVDYKLSMALIRVGTKLDTGYLRLSGLEGLCRMFPPDYVGPDRKTPGAWDTPETPGSVGLEVVNFAREYDLPILLPKAFYHCAKLTIKEIVNGVPDGEGVVERLSEQDMLTVLQGREKLLFTRRHTVLSFINSFTDNAHEMQPTADCPQEPQKGGDTCFHWFMRMHLDFNRSRFAEMDTKAMQAIPKEATDIIQSHLCESCWKSFDGHMRNGYFQAHDQLPRYFGLPIWSELHDIQDKIESKWDPEDEDGEDVADEDEDEDSDSEDLYNY